MVGILVELYLMVVVGIVDNSQHPKDYLPNFVFYEIFLKFASSSGGRDVTGGYDGDFGAAAVRLRVWWLRLWLWCLWHWWLYTNTEIYSQIGVILLVTRFCKI